MSASRAKSWIRSAQSSTSWSTTGSVQPARSTSAPCEPRYEIAPIATIARASEARRPLTHATTP